MSVSEIEVEVVFALPGRQSLLALVVKTGATVAEVVRASGLEATFPGCGIEQLAVGIWGRKVARDYVVKQGDRVELYRPLALDPKEARRQLALSGQTMGSADASTE